MRKQFIAAACAGCLSVWSGGATAEDVLDVYLGGFGGYEEYGAQIIDTGVIVASDSTSGFGGGVLAGVDLNIDDWHLAVEGEYGWSAAGKTETIDTIDGPVDSSTDIDRTLGFSARYGYAIDGTYLVYGRVGWVETKASFAVSGAGLDASASVKLDGVAFGGGLELLLSESLSIRAEYVRNNYEVGLGGLVDADRDSVRGGIAIWF